MVIHRIVKDASGNIISKPKVACATLNQVKEPVRLDSSGNGLPLDAAMTNGYSSLRAATTMTRNLDKDSKVELRAWGLNPNTSYGAHVHALPCSVQDGGPHYKIDPNIAETLAVNELWLTLDTGNLGAAATSVRSEHLARAEAQSIVVHDTDRARLVCIDLEFR